MEPALVDPDGAVGQPDLIRQALRASLHEPHLSGLMTAARLRSFLPSATQKDLCDVRDPEIHYDQHPRAVLLGLAAAAALR